MKKAFKQHRIAGIGEILWDMLPQGKSLGGAPANFALHAQALGGQAAVVSSLGKDNAGLEILQQLSRKRMTTEYIQMNSYPTGWVDVNICKKGHATYTIHGNVAWDYLGFSSEIRELAQTCDAVCFGTLAQRHPVSRRCIQEFLAATKEDCLRVFDINLRQDHFSREVIEDSLRAATVLKLNDDELAVLRDMFALSGPDESALKVLLNQYQLDLIAFTQGSSGSMMIDQTTVCHCPGISVSVRDTIGAGDSFTAAMVMGRLYGLSLDEMNRLAGKVAAYVCSQAGATPTLPADLIAELKQKTPVTIRELTSPVDAEEIRKRKLRKANQTADYRVC